MPLIQGKQLANDTVTSTQAETTTGTISTVNAGDSSAEGSGAGLSRRDHQHAVSTAAANTIQVGAGAGEGVAVSLARSDHTHAVTSPGAPADVTKAAAAAGSSNDVARADHKHDVTTAAAIELAEANAEGSATTLARSDHTHDHGDRSGGTLHAAATPSVNGFMSSTDKTKLDTLQDAAGIDAKESCRVRAQGNLTLSGEQTIDGVLTSTDRVLVDQQSTGSQDGIYVSAAGAWARSADAPTGSNASGWVVAVTEGTTDGDKIFMCTSNKGSDVVGTDGLAFAASSGGSPRGAGAGLVLNGNDLDVVANGDGSIVVNANDIQVGTITEAQHGDLALNDGLQHAAATTSFNGYMSSTDKTKLDGVTAGAEPNDTPNQESVTTQTITGSDTAMSDTLNNTPVSNASVNLWLNGVHQEQGATKDYTISGSTITWLASTGTAVDQATTDVLIASYLS